MRARALLLALATLTAGLAGCAGPSPSDPSTGDPAEEPEAADTALVAAAHGAAAEAGAEVLREGGNAIDAAAATQLALNVVEPHFSGIGGGLFLVAYLADEDRLVVVDGREVAPGGLDVDEVRDRDDENPTWQGYRVGVPGTLAALDHALDAYGTRDLGDVDDPAVQLARDGFEVYPYLSTVIQQNRDKLASWPASADVFLEGAVCVDREAGCVGGTAPPPGTTLEQPDLADTLEQVAQGPAAFYEGPIGGDVADTVQARHGAMTPADLASYEPVEREPIEVAFANRTVASAPPPSGGTIVLQALGMLDGLLDGAGFQQGPAVHRTLEALKLAYADRRAHVGDPAVVDVPTQGMLDPAYLDQRREQIGPEANTDPQPGDPWAYQEGNGTEANASAARSVSHTSHFVVADHEGNVVSTTTTIERAFGTGMVVPGRGFLLNNELNDFAWDDEDSVNAPAPDKRPRSSMSPTVVLDEGEPVAAVGSPGGLTIPSTVTEVTRNLLAHEVDLETAVEASRQYPMHPPPEVLVDRDLPPATLADLEDRGHRPVPTGLGIGNVHAIERLGDDGWTGWADTRRGQGGVVTVEAGGG